MDRSVLIIFQDVRLSQGRRSYGRLGSENYRKAVEHRSMSLSILHRNFVVAIDSLGDVYSLNIVHTYRVYIMRTSFE